MVNMSNNILPSGNYNIYGVWGELLENNIQGEPIDRISELLCECGAHITYGENCDNGWHSDWCKLSPSYSKDNK